MTEPSHDDPAAEPSGEALADPVAESVDADLVVDPVEPGADASGETLVEEPSADPSDFTVEDLVANLETVTAERDNYLDGMRRLQAEFENYRKAVAKRELDARERANESLVSELLPVLDACDGAIANGADDVGPVRLSLLEILAKQGLERIEEAGAPFDPEQHEAVMHEPSDDDTGPTVSQLLRVGYRWKGRTVRPAMVQVKG